MLVSPQDLPGERYDRLFEDASLYPIQAPDPAHIDFVPMTYETYRRSTFLDRRIKPARPAVWRADVDQIEAARPPRATPGHLHFVFHNAYCQSTLLSNALAQLPGSLVLREPVTLLQVAERRAPDALLPLLLTLLSRRDDPRDTVIVKASSACNVIAPALMAAAPSAHALFVYSGIRAFILAVLRDPARAHRMRGTFSQTDPSPADAARLGAWWPEADMNRWVVMQDDAKLAAWVWIGRLRALGRLQNCVGPQRITTLDGTRIAANPRDTLRLVNDALDLAGKPADLEQVARSPLWRQDAKDPSQPYEADSRASELDDVARRHEHSIADALDWARTLMRSITDDTMPLPRRCCGLSD